MVQPAHRHGPAGVDLIAERLEGAVAAEFGL